MAEKKQEDFESVGAELALRRQVLCEQIQRKKRRVPTNSAFVPEVVDNVEKSEIDTSEDISFALMEHKIDELRRVDEALARIKEGTYGNCGECGGPISERRLAFLPFAVRCKSCEEKRENASRRRYGHWEEVTDLFDHSHGIL